MQTFPIFSNVCGNVCRNNIVIINDNDSLNHLYLRQTILKT